MCTIFNIVTLLLAILSFNAFPQNYTSDSLAVEGIMSANNYSGGYVSNITDSAEGRIKRLKVNDADHFDTLPGNFLGTLNSLRYLEIYKCSLTTLPETLWTIASIETLIVCFNKIEEISNRIVNLTNLKYLRICPNNFDGVPSIVFDINNLLELNMQSCNLDSIPDSIVKLTNLKVIKAGYNNFVELPSNIGSLSQLEFIELRYNQIQSVTTSICNLNNLSKLYLFNNKLTDLPDCIMNMSNLTSCQVAGNQICNPPADLASWLDTVDDMPGGWRNAQECTTGTGMLAPNSRYGYIEKISPSLKVFNIQGKLAGVIKKTELHASAGLNKGILITKNENSGEFKRITIIE